MKENIIKALIDARIIESIKKKMPHKLSTIAQYLGDPIISDDQDYSSMMCSTWGDEISDEQQIAMADEDATTRHLGYHYDSLKYGINFEIVVKTYDEMTESIRVSMDGIVVYLEEDTQLKCYAPSDRWERHMEDLFAQAKLRENKETAVKDAEDKVLFEKKKKTFYENLKSLWGY
jgi:hypothetical protein